MRRILCICLLFLFSGNAAWAGFPIEETVTCPVGGEKFTVTETASCTTFGRTMSFRPITSCEFVTRLPVCPSNGLPVYQEFAEDQVAELRSFLETPDYAALKELPPWRRAYGLSAHLGQSGTETAFWLLMNAMWYEAGSFFESRSALDHLLHEAEFELKRTPQESQAFLNAILAYALAHAGRIEESVERLTLAKQAQETPEYLQQYISAIEACQSNAESPDCHPDAAFVP